MILQVPDEQALSEIFRSTPTTKSVPQDGLWFYEVTNPNGINLEFSFNIFERSIQTVLKIGDRTVQVVSLEGATVLLDTRDYHMLGNRRIVLRAEVEYKNARGVLEIFLEPEIFVKYSALTN